MNPFANYPTTPYSANPYANANNQNGITWVQGIEGAKAYQMLPNGIALLMDSESEGKFYIKTSDNVGMCNLRIFEYTEVTNTPAPQMDLSNYVTKDELKEVVSSLKGDINE